MGRGVRCVAVAVLVAGLSASAAVAQSPPPDPDPEPTLEPAPEPPLPRGVIAPRVTIDGVDVSGLNRRQARARLIDEIVRPKHRAVVVSFRSRRMPITPRSVGYAALVDRAITGALNVGRSQPDGPKDIPLTERINRKRLKAMIERRTARHRVAPRDVRVAYANGRVRIIRSRPGIDVNVEAAMRRVEAVMLSGRRGRAFALPRQLVRADVATVPSQIIIDRGRFKLFMVRSAGIVTYPIAVGQSAYPTPSGRFSVVNMQRNPTWYPPDSRWAAGLGPVPPGSDNPLGTRWIGISSPGIGIHGTPSPWSIGTRASHGCIRMYIRDAERLYSMVEVGIPVTIV